MRGLGYLAVLLVLLVGCTKGSKQEDIEASRPKFVATASKGRMSVQFFGEWKSTVGDLGISLRHPSGANLWLMLSENVPQDLYDDMLDTDKRIRGLVAKNGNPSLNKKSGWKLEHYEFDSPAGRGSLMINHPPDNVRDTDRRISGNTFAEPLILITGDYKRGDTAIRKDIEAMLTTLRIDKTANTEPKDNVLSPSRR